MDDAADRSQSGQTSREVKVAPGRTSFTGVFAGFDDHVAAIREHANGLGVAAQAAGLDAMTATCPGWAIRDLVSHIGGVHRWAAGNIASGRVSEEESAQMFSAPPDDALLSWYADGYEALLTTLTEADRDVECFTFLPEIASPLEFWARRQAHETAIHRVDAESARRTTPEFDTSFAVDGLDELINGFVRRKGGGLRSDSPVTIAVTPSDASAAWWIQVGPEGRSITTTSGEADPADLTLRGPAAQLYLLLWNRASRDQVEVIGQESLLDLWREGVRVRWS
jgi:uncharacterized protein (TIGR03083 family)